MMNKTPREFVAAISVFAIFLSYGCGLKGDLYIPAKETSPPPASVDAGNDEDGAADPDEEQPTD